MLKVKEFSEKSLKIPAGGGHQGQDKFFTIDAALEQTYFGRFNYVVIFFTGLVSINVVFESLGISYVLPVLNCDLNLSYQQKGVLGAVNFIGIIVSSPFWGFLADTTGRKKIMLPALYLNFCLAVISSVSINFEMLVILRFLGGIFLSAGSATVYAYIGEFHCNKYRNKAILSGATISATSGVLFPFVVGISINQTWQLSLPWFDFIYKPWRFCFVACGLPGLLCGIILTFLPESPKYLLSCGRPEEALEVLRTIHKINTKGLKHTQEFKVEGLLTDSDTPRRDHSVECSKNMVQALWNSIWNQTAPLFMSPYLKNTLLASFIQFVLFYSAHGFYMWFPHILNSALQYSTVSQHPAQLCEIMDLMRASNNQTNEYTNDTLECSETLETGTFVHSIVLEIVYIFLLLLAAYATGKLDRRVVLCLCTFICGACGILSLIIEIPLVAIYMMIIMLCCGIAITVVNSIVVDIYPTNLRAMAVCISLMLGRIGSVTGSNILGVLIDRYCNAASYSFMTSLVLTGFLGFLLPKTNKFPEIKENKENI